MLKRYCRYIETCGLLRAGLSTAAMGIAACELAGTPLDDTLGTSMFGVFSRDVDRVKRTKQVRDLARASRKFCKAHGGAA